MKNRKIIIILVSVLVLLSLSAGGYFVYKKYFSKSSTNEISGLPGQLFGPRAAQKAKTLDPAQVLYWTNKYRNDNNLASLTVNTTLVKAAQAKTDDMFDKQYFEHVSPSGVSPSDLVTATGYSYKTTGENLALGDFSSEKDLVDAWMASPGHRANILNKDYTEIGIAADLNTYQDRGKTWLAVQEFGKPLANCDKPNTNTSTDINNKKSTYDGLISQINNLNAEISNLNNQANQKVQQGNDIYASTHDQAQAQPYWDEATTLRAQAATKTAQAADLQKQTDTLSQEIQTESSKYNAQVDAYNTCIKQ